MGVNLPRTDYIILAFCIYMYTIVGLGTLVFALQQMTSHLPKKNTVLLALSEYGSRFTMMSQCHVRASFKLLQVAISVSIG